MACFIPQQGILVSDTEITSKDKITMYFHSKNEESQQKRLIHPTVYHNLLQDTETTPGIFLIMFKDMDHTTHKNTYSHKSLKYAKIEMKI